VMHGINVFTHAADAALAEGNRVPRLDDAVDIPALLLLNARRLSL